MSAVTILTYAAQAATGSGAAVDVSAFSTLRLDMQLAADLGTSPELMLTIEDAPAATGPWRTVETRRFVATAVGEPFGWSGRGRFLLAGFDSFIRVSWTGSAQGPGVPAFLIGLTGDGQPDAS